MEILIKKLDEEAVIPSYAKPGDAGMDLVATSKWTDNDGNICYGTGIAVKIPEGYAGFLFPRSSVSKYTLSLCNCVGVIDSGYTGEIKFKFKPTLVVGGISDDCPDGNAWDLDSDDTVIALPGKTPYINPDILYYSPDVYDIGDKIGQLIIMPIPKVEFKEVDELPKTERGQGGFGSTGN